MNPKKFSFTPAIKKLIKQAKVGSCFICQMQKDRSLLEAHGLIYEDNKVLVFLDKYPAKKGQAIVAFKKHIEKITEIEREDFLHLQNILYLLDIALHKVLSPDKVIILSTHGTVPHFHFILIPIHYKGPIEERLKENIDAISKTKVIRYKKGEKKRLLQKLREAMSQNKSNIRILSQ